ncbi:ABC transporter permease [Streptomyces thermolineatus]|uniref:Transport permease protein n=1 Tax=Streptomyces thermolineatus TaxID=44033 RepID=A0ABP6A4K7_9ACTN
MAAPTPAPGPASPAPVPAAPAAPSVVSVSVAVLRAEARLFAREPGAWFWIVLFPTALLTVLGLVPAFREPSKDLGGLRVIDLYVPVALLLSTITAGVQSMPNVLTGYRERGILRRLSTTPARPVALLLSQVVLHGAAVLVSAVLALAVGRLAFGVALPRQPLGYAVAFVLAALAALATGTVIAALSRTVKIAAAFGTIVFFPTMFSAGVWAPVQTMPQTLQTIVQATPLGAAARALGQAAAGDWPDWTLLGVSALWAVVLIAVSARWFRWE